MSEQQEDVVVLPARGAGALAERFIRTGANVLAVQHEEFPDGTVGTILPIDYITDEMVLVLSGLDSAHAILSALDIAYGVQRYYASCLAIGYEATAETAKDPAFQRLESYLGVLLSAVPRASAGNITLGYNGSEDEIFLQNNNSEPNRNESHAEREALQGVFMKAFGKTNFVRLPDAGALPLGGPITGVSPRRVRVRDQHHEPVSNRKVLVSIASYGYLAQEMKAAGEYDSIWVEYDETPQGIPVPKINEKLYGREVVLVAGTPSDEDFLELMLLLCVLREKGVDKIDVVMPYYGAARSDRAVKEGEIVTAKTRASLISRIPQPPQGTRVIMADLHSDGIPSYFDGDVRAEQIYCESVITPVILSKLGSKLKFVAAADAGRYKWVKAYVTGLREAGHDVDLVGLEKVRVDGKETKDHEVIVGREHIPGNAGAVYDDLSNTCGTLAGALKALAEHGGGEMVLALSHDPSVEGAILRILERDNVTAFITTDSHPNALRDLELAREHGLEDKFVVVSIAGLLNHAVEKGPRRV